MGKQRVERGRGRRADVVKKQQRASSRPFYAAVALIAIIGIVLIVRSVAQSKASPAVTTVSATPAQAEGYVMGNPNAPVKVLEFADFECPACGQFAVVTEPDVRKRVIDAGLASYTFYDFPLPMHKNSMAASNAAACAAEQGKFWPMHDRLFAGQTDWNGEATSNPKSVFHRYATEIGLDADKWEQCYDTRRAEPRVLANQAEGNRRNVNQTPTFVIGNRQIGGALTGDQFVAYVDSAAAEFASRATSRADSAQQKTKQDAPR